ELALAVVEQQVVGLQAVIRHENVEVAVLVEVGGRDAAAGLELLLGPPDLLEGAVALVAEDGVRLVAAAVTRLVAGHGQVEEAVAVEVAPARADADLHRPGREIDLLELLALDVAVQLAGLPAEQVQVAVVVKVAPDGRAADLGDLLEALAALVVPDLAADAHV